MRAALIALAATGCLRSTAFHCADDAACTTGGRCEAVGFCSFPDPSCASGARFGDYAEDYADRCVELAPDAASLCPASYAAVPGAGAHVYRRAAAAAWTAQRDACAAAGGYLAIPDDGAELAALVAQAPADETWFGITDQAAEGRFITVRGAPAAFLPWDTAEPNNDPGDADCVRARPNARFADDRCGTAHPAVCECDP